MDRFENKQAKTKLLKVVIALLGWLKQLLCLLANNCSAWWLLSTEALGLGGNTLQRSVATPTAAKEVLADKIYCNRTNRAKLKELGTVLVAKALGVPRHCQIT
jgi:hypothetical protein